MNRRTFLHSVAAGAAAAARPAAPSERVRVAIVGCGGMGRMNLADFQKQPDAKIAVVCDVWEANARRAFEFTGGRAEVYKDYRRVLERKDIDAVVVATPDHWHPLITIEAYQAGKDVYVEKPVSHCVREGRLMVEAARRCGRVVQVGLQRRSGSHFQRAVRAVQEGRIGTVHFAECWNHSHGLAQGIGTPPDSDPPEGRDWDFWLGPAPKVPFNPARLRFHWFWDYAGGQLTNWGVHLLDVVHWALGFDAPLSAASSGGRFYTRDLGKCPAADIEIGHRATAVCHLGNIAFRTGQKILWDARAERITNSDEANRLLARPYRPPWKLPGLEG